MSAPDVEALARVLADDAVWDWIMGESWYGYPDSDNEAEMAEAIDNHMPNARDKAETYLRIAGVLK